MIDWSAPEKTKEAVVREAVPDAEMRVFGHGKVAVFSPTIGQMGVICYLGTREKRRTDAWESAYRNDQVQAYVAAHRTQEAKPCYCDPGYCHVNGDTPELQPGFYCKVKGTQEAPAEAQEYVSCPFCKEDDFDLIGLKAHFPDCAAFNETEVLHAKF